MNKKLLATSALLLAILATTGCTKCCRCIKYNTGVDYYNQEELSAQGKTCSEMRYMTGLAAQRYSVCEWVYNE